MKSQRTLLIAAVIFLIGVFAFGAYFYKQEQQTEQVAQVEAHAERLVRPYSPRLGQDGAKVQLVEFLDPECEACRAFHPVVKNILEDYEGHIQLVIRYMPFHGNSAYAATVLEAARVQGKYWEALDTIFAHQPEWGSHHNPRPELLLEYMKNLGLDMQKLEEDMKNPNFQWRISMDQEDGMLLGVRGTPSFFVNGVALERLGQQQLREAIDQELAN